MKHQDETSGQRKFHLICLSWTMSLRLCLSCIARTWLAWNDQFYCSFRARLGCASILCHPDSTIFAHKPNCPKWPKVTQSRILKAGWTIYRLPNAYFGERGTMTTAHFRSAPVYVVIVKWSMNLFVFFCYSRDLCTLLSKNNISNRSEDFFSEKNI